MRRVLLFLSELCFHLLLISVHSDRSRSITDWSRSITDRFNQSSAHVRPVHTIKYIFIHLSKVTMIQLSYLVVHMVQDLYELQSYLNKYKFYTLFTLCLYIAIIISSFAGHINAIVAPPLINQLLNYRSSTLMYSETSSSSNSRFCIIVCSQMLL